jgi:hypothetical protein
MTKAAFNKIAEGLTEALAVTRGEAEPYRLHVSPEVAAELVAALRQIIDVAADKPVPIELYKALYRARTALARAEAAP